MIPTLPPQNVWPPPTDPPALVAELEQDAAPEPEHWLFHYECASSSGRLLILQATGTRESIFCMVRRQARLHPEGEP